MIIDIVYGAVCVFVGMYLMGYLASSAGAQRWLNFWRWWK